MIKQALILAGGFGTRLAELTKETPKPMLLISSNPFIDYLLWNFKRQGISDIIISIGYFGDKIVNYYGDGSDFGVSITYVQESEPLGTGGAIRLACPQLDSEFIVINGDSLFDINYKDLYTFFSMHSAAMVAMGIRQVSNASRFGRVILNKKEHVCDFLEKEDRVLPGVINGGVYIMKREILELVTEGFFSLENDLFPKLIDQSVLVAKQFDGFFIDIGVPDDYKRAQIDLPHWKKNLVA